jgi:hypothetical protein
MILKVDVAGASWHDIGEELWQESLTEALRAEAQVIAQEIAFALPDAHAPKRQAWLLRRLLAEMTEALVGAGDSYQAPDGVLYSLIEDPMPAVGDRGARLGPVTPPPPGDPVVEEVLSFEDLPLGSQASRRVVVRWSDGSEGEAIRYYADEVLFCEGDVLGKTRAELRSLHFRRDRDSLQS